MPAARAGGGFTTRRRTSTMDLTSDASWLAPWEYVPGLHTINGPDPSDPALVSARERRLRAETLCGGPVVSRDWSGGGWAVSPVEADAPYSVGDSHFARWVSVDPRVPDIAA